MCGFNAVIYSLITETKGLLSDNVMAAKISCCIRPVCYALLDETAGRPCEKQCDPTLLVPTYCCSTRSCFCKRIATGNDFATVNIPTEIAAV